ncbi:MAG: EAL domain-containing protein [Thermodesulfobacteriota bacterium]
MSYLQTHGEEHVQREMAATGNGESSACFSDIVGTRIDASTDILAVPTLQANEVFVGLIKALPFPAFLLDSSGLIQLGNDSAEKVLRKLSPDWRGPCCGPFQMLFSCHDTALEYELRLLSARSSEKSQTMEGAIRIGKRYMWNRIHMFPIRLGEEVWVLLILEDLTPRMRLLLLKKKEYRGILEDRLRVRLMQMIEMRRNGDRGDSSTIYADQATVDTDTFKRLEYMAYYDSLTGLPNRFLFFDHLKHVLARSQRNKCNVGIMFLDLDRFKDVNDAHGHLAGDTLLAKVAKRIQQCVRDSDIVARLGGDEFGVILPDITDSRSVALLASRIVARMSRAFDLDRRRCFMTVSIGIAMYPDDGSDSEVLLKHADMAMYHAKQAGGNCYRYFSAEMNELASAKLEMGASIRSALRQGAFFLQYQPTFHIPTGRIIGCEALIRWNRPAVGRLQAREFIPFASETDLIDLVDEWTLFEACRQIREWQSSHGTTTKVSVNLSDRHLRKAGLDILVQSALDKTGIDPALLELEMSERAFMHDPNLSTEIMGRLKDLGVHLAIQDFGVGYSSLSQLKTLPVDRIKIHPSFLSDCNSKTKNGAVLKAVFSIADHLRFNVTASCVETQEQLDFVVEHGCEEAQGHYFCLPLSPQEFVRQSQDRR